VPQEGGQRALPPHRAPRGTGGGKGSPPRVVSTTRPIPEFVADEMDPRRRLKAHHVSFHQGEPQGPPFSNCPHIPLSLVSYQTSSDTSVTLIFILVFVFENRAKFRSSQSSLSSQMSSCVQVLSSFLFGSHQIPSILLVVAHFAKCGRCVVSKGESWDVTC
jgi:hypothetical protein